MDSRHCEALGNLIQVTTTLTDLNLHTNLIRDNGAIQIAKALEAKTSHTNLKLNLRTNSIGPDGGVAIGK